MKPALFLFLIYILLFNYACNNSNQQTGNQKALPDSSIVAHHKPSSGYADTLKINTASAIFFKPDSLQWLRLKQINDTMVYASFQHDCFYQMRNARNVLKEHFPHIKIIDVISVRFLRFELSNGSVQYIDLDSIDDPCGIFLFDTNKNPHPTDMMNIETELGFYFK